MYAILLLLLALTSAQETEEKYEFQADVARLLDIIINSLYMHKEVFLRELISNSADAINKIRYLALTQPDILNNYTDFQIKIDFDKENRTITITDNGIGMTKEHLIKNLGTVAKSGTAAFVEAMAKGASSNLIGQFGVGFYSSYMVANKVVVVSKHNDDDQYVWISQAGGHFTVFKDPQGNTMRRGTSVTLHIKEESTEFLDQETIKKLIEKYSGFIDFPILLHMQEKTHKEVDDDTNSTVNATEQVGNETENVEIKEESKKEKKKKTIEETVWNWNIINKNKALWLRNKDNITEEEYHDFYKALTNDYEKPIAYSHIKAEGEMEFKSILFVPEHAPYDMFENYYNKKSTIKLFVKRVMVTDEFEEFLPRYLSFVRGVLDSDDLPLNVGREQLQQLKILKVINKKLVRKAIDMIMSLNDQEEEKLEDVDEEEEESDVKKMNATEKTARYEKFWKQFGKNIKLGIVEDAPNKNKLSKLLRYGYIICFLMTISI